MLLQLLFEGRRLRTEVKTVNTKLPRNNMFITIMINLEICRRIFQEIII